MPPPLAGSAGRANVMPAHPGAAGGVRMDGEGVVLKRCIGCRVVFVVAARVSECKVRCLAGRWCIFFSKFLTTDGSWASAVGNAAGIAGFVFRRRAWCHGLGLVVGAWNRGKSEKAAARLW